MLSVARGHASADIIERRYSDDPAAGGAFAAKGNVNTGGSQEGLAASQTSGECAGIFRPAH